MKKHWILFKAIPALLILFATGCQRETIITGCTMHSATNYSSNVNAPTNNICQYSGTSVFYFDAPTPPGNTIIQAAIPNLAGVPVYYDSTGVPQCGTSVPFFTQTFSGVTDTLTAAYTVGTGATYANWQGNVRFTANSCTTILLPAGNVVFYSPDTTYVNPANANYIIININGSSSDSRYINQLDSTAPAFGHTICDFFLPPGTYTYSASSSNPNTPFAWSGSFTITADKQYKAIKLQ